MLRFFLIIFLILYSLKLHSQENLIIDNAQDTLIYSIDSIVDSIEEKSLDNKSEPYDLFSRNCILPSLLISYGGYLFLDNTIKSTDHNIREFRNNHFGKFHSKVDDYIQYLPAATALIMNLSGVKANNSLGNAIIVYAMSMVFVGSMTLSLKYGVARLRPDNSSRNSFNSGHTAMAFASAEFLRREYGADYPYLAYAGYIIAGTTGVMRMLNNRHWFSDVVAGAGIGILSTSLSYLIFDKYLKENGYCFSINPIYDGRNLAMSLSINF